MIETFAVECPYCHALVFAQWQHPEAEGEGGSGLLPGRYALVGDWLFHDDCWDKFVAENPP